MPKMSTQVKRAVIRKFVSSAHICRVLSGLDLEIHWIRSAVSRDSHDSQFTHGDPHHCIKHVKNMQQNTNNHVHVTLCKKDKVCFNKSNPHTHTQK